VLASLNARIAPLRAVVGSAGLTMFRQINIDGSGHVSRADLLAALVKIPPLPAAAMATSAVLGDNKEGEEAKSCSGGGDSSSSSSSEAAANTTRVGEAAVAPMEASAESSSSSPAAGTTSKEEVGKAFTAPPPADAVPVEGRHVSEAEEAFAADGATEATVDGLLKELDVDGDGTVDEDEWVAMLTRLPYLKVSSASWW